MQNPLPFREVASLMLRNTRTYSSVDSDLGAQLGIRQRAAIAIAYAGQIAGGAAMIGAIALLTEPLLSDPFTAFSGLLFIVALVAAFISAQSLVSYALYRLGRSYWPAEA
jgi:hypothetical protein